jgi:glycosyltransferase involved in cell wall biosynthesis
MRILIVSDAWLPQVNGVVRTIESTRDELLGRGHAVDVVGPDRFRSIPCPTYPEIRLAFGQRERMASLIENFDPDAIHISTEGPLGWAARRYCLKRRISFSTAFHTQFPEYVWLRSGIPLSSTYALLRHFHGASGAVMVATETLHRRLEKRGFRNLVRWHRGVDTERFRPNGAVHPAPAPVHLCVGRVAVEKNLEAFLSLPTPGPKVVVGDGPQLPALRSKYPDVRFTGGKTGDDLVHEYAAADVFVFPSRTDTFGLVMLEALACGTPVAAYPVQGPIDVIGDAPVGCLDDDLGRAMQRALDVPRGACRDFAMGYSWAACTDQFVHHLRPFR